MPKTVTGDGGDVVFAVRELQEAWRAIPPRGFPNPAMPTLCTSVYGLATRNLYLNLGMPQNTLP